MQSTTIKIGTRPKHDFKIWLSANKQYYWVYYDGNYEPLVTSEMYTRLEDARSGLANFKHEMGQFFKK